MYRIRRRRKRSIASPDWPSMSMRSPARARVNVIISKESSDVDVERRAPQARRPRKLLLIESRLASPSASGPSQAVIPGRRRQAAACRVVRAKGEPVDKDGGSEAHEVGRHSLRKGGRPSPYPPLSPDAPMLMLMRCCVELRTVARVHFGPPLASTGLSGRYLLRPHPSNRCLRL